MKYIIAFIILFLSFGVYVRADTVSQFVFITDPQSVDVNQLSKDITIQSQNASGLSQSIPETFDLVFTSSSATGVFLNSSGNPVSTTMSKNTANRTFYYKDSSAGDTTLSVVATGRDSKQSFTASQHVYIGLPLPEGTTTESIATTTSGSSTDSGSGYAYSSPVTLGTSKETIEFEVSAGRDRLVTVGNTLTFKAVATKTQNVTEQNIGYMWSFGDGTVSYGQTVTHAYRFAGEYVVMLNATYSDRQAVARMVVKVISPTIVMSRLPGGFALANTLGTEINLEGWTLSNGSKSFVFPKDTVVAGNKKIVFADEVTGINTDTATLYNQLGKTYASVQPVFTQGTSTIVIPERTIEKIPEKITVKSQVSPEPFVTAPPVQTSPKKKITLIVATSTLTKGSQTATAIVFRAPTQTPIVSRVFSLPIKGFNFIRHLFVED